MALLLLFHPALPQAVGGDWRLSERADGAAGEQFGWALDVGPDYDGDGWPEILVGAPDRQAIGRVGGVSLVRGGTGQHLWDFVSPYPIQIAYSVGFAVSFVPDLNADGFADVVVGDPNDQEIAITSGRVYVLDGISGGIIREHTGEPRGNGSYGDITGSAVLGIEDVDGDGYGDYVVGSPFSDLGLGTTDRHGKITLYSGVAGTVIWTLGGQNDGLGWCLALGPDLTGDGHPEILATANGALGKVHYVDSVSGLALQTIVGLPSETGGNANMGLALGTAELDGDDLPDLIAGAPYARSLAGFYSGYVAAFSSSTKQLLWRYNSSIPGEVFGTSVSGTADLDLDGIEDVLVGVPTDFNYHSTGKGYVQVLSGRDGSPLWWFRTTDQADSFYGYDVEAYGRDGRRNLVLVGEPVRWTTSGPDGALHAVEFLPFLEASALQLSAAAGGVVRYALAFPVSEASKPYALLASASGRGPTMIGGIQVPLTADGVFARSVAGSYPSGLSQPRGMLDAQGRAQATFGVGAGALAGQVGRTIHLAAVTHSGGSGRLASIAVPLQILP